MSFVSFSDYCIFITMLLRTQLVRGLGRQSRFLMKQCVHADPNLVAPLSSKLKNDIAGSSTANISPDRMSLLAITCLPTWSLYAKFRLTEKSGNILLAHGILGGCIDVLTLFKSCSKREKSNII